MYVGTALVVASVSYICGICIPRISIGRLIVLVCFLLIIATLALRLALQNPWGGFRILAYFLADLVVNLPMLLFWIFAALVFNPREAKRLFGFVGAGGTFACILAGFLIRPFVAHLGMENLLLAVAFLVAGFMATTHRLSRLEAARVQPAAGGGGKAAGPSHLGYYAGLEIILVPGATGYLDTNYLGKAEYALESLRDNDFVWVHVEAPDEAGHAGDIEAKIKAIEEFDSKVVGTILRGMEDSGEEYMLLVLPDHLTPISVRTHVHGMVPFAACGAGIEKKSVDKFSEATADSGSMKFPKGHTLMSHLVELTRK